MRSVRLGLIWMAFGAFVLLATAVLLNLPRVP